MKLFCCEKEYEGRAIALAQRTETELIKAFGDARGILYQAGDAGYQAGELYLRLDKNGLSLCRDDLSIMGDFTELIPRIRRGNLESEMLVKASKLKQAESGRRVQVLFDATAGMGEDSFILAAAGFRVILFEYNKIIGSLLEDALIRAAHVPELAHIAGRMELHIGDSIAAMNGLANGREKAEAEAAGGDESAAAAGIHPDVILLDPMFPARTKSAMVKKKFQLLQQLECPCADEAKMLGAAINACPQKIVIKRPAKGPYLGGVKPDYALDGKAIRYDCIVNVASRKKIR